MSIMQPMNHHRNLPDSENVKSWNKERGIK